MFDTVTHNLPEGYRVVPSYPKYAVNEKGDVLKISTRKLMFGWVSDNDDDVPKISMHVPVIGNPRQIHTVYVSVSDMVKEAFPAIKEVSLDEMTMSPKFAPKADSYTLAGPRPKLFNHGQGDHISSPECSTCYLGFEATTEELRQMLWVMAVEFSEEVDATASELLDQIRESVTGKAKGVV